MFHVKPQNAQINGLVFVNSRPPLMIFPKKNLDLSLFYDKTPQHLPNCVENPMIHF